MSTAYLLRQTLLRRDPSDKALAWHVLCPAIVFAIIHQHTLKPLQTEHSIDFLHRCMLMKTDSQLSGFYCSQPAYGCGESDLR